MHLDTESTTWGDDQTVVIAGGLRCEIVTDFDRLEELAGPWDRLWRALPRQEVFTTLAWARACWRASGHRRRLCTPVVFDDDRVVGILPLATESRTLRFLGHPFADYNEFLCESDTGAAVLEAALRGLDAAGRICRRCILDNVPEWSHLDRLLSNLPGDLQARLIGAASVPCPALVLGTDREAALAAVLGKESLKRHCNKLRRQGELAFRHLEDREAIRRHLPEFFRQHKARRAMANDTSLFRDERSRAFYEALIEEIDPGGPLRFGVLELSGRPIAYHLGFESGGVFTWYKPTFDINLWDCSPGEVLLRRLLEYVQDCGAAISEFDFTVGDESFKHRFANVTRRNRTWELRSSTASAAAARFAFRAADRVRGLPRVHAALKSATGVAENLRSARRRHGAPKVALKAVQRATRAAFYARDEVLVYTLEQSDLARLVPDDTRVKGSTLGPGTLADLALLVAEYPDERDRTWLHDARVRLKQGDRLYILRQGDEVLHTAWLGVREDVVAPYEVGARCRIQLDRPEAIIYDCWTPPPARGQGVYSAMLRYLASSALREFGRVWIYCLRNNHPSRRGIEKTGFRFRGRMVRFRILGLIERAYVEFGPENGATAGTTGKLHASHGPHDADILA